MCCLYFLTCTCALFVYLYGDHRDLHSFPTRRSSDLSPESVKGVVNRHHDGEERVGEDRDGKAARSRDDEAPNETARSEEHTSELQSLRHLVCRLLLEKKKRKRSKSPSQDSRNTTDQH